MTTDLAPGWTTHKRSTFDSRKGYYFDIPSGTLVEIATNLVMHLNVNRDSNAKGDDPHLPGVTYLSDLASVIDSKRQTGYTDDDPFASPKSYAHVPHEYLAPDGFPRTDCWLNPSCRFAVLTNTDQNAGKGAVVRRALDEYRKQGVEGVPANPPLQTAKIRRRQGPRHAKPGRKIMAAKATDQSATSANRLNKTYDCHRYRLNDPLLPYEDYDRTMDIIFNCYKIVTHGKGQFVDRDSHELLFTYSFEDLEAMTPEKRQEHQDDVSTVLMSTKLFKRLPTPKPLAPPIFSSSPLLINPIPANRTNLRLPDDTNLPSSPLSSLPPSDADMDRDNTSLQMPDDPDPPSSPLTSLPPSDAEVNEDDLNHAQNSFLNNVTTIPRKRKRSDRHNGVISKKLPVEEKFRYAGLNRTKRKRTITKPTITKKVTFGKIAPTLKKQKRNITTNGALIHGRMYCFGQTVGYSRNILLGPYRPNKASSRSLYRTFLDKLAGFGARLGGRFKDFCDVGFQVARQQLNTLRAPPMTATSKFQPSGPHDFASNFAFTLGNFYNKPHTDNDKGKVYCIWYPIDSLSGKIVTECEGFELEGGWFIFPEYRVAFKFGGKFAVQIAWNGKSTFHHTLPSHEKIALNKQGKKVHYTRLGCSSQITYKMARASVKIGTDKQYNHTSNCERKLMDAEDILEMPDRNWKE
ncbi:uncharacterized protein MELLADRAFT_85070 [Melampsora larici-populina 98AG31]|uniref:Tet-like 2OG-Fe(II) oxygenase domain-containing protein n=1 Tax=Melampsora larici-populina (strain 98AG31 / pathotype 3-4-7) TaxID=747676 RepID=F4RHD3_MELLP|nr:uncharacterized protein MELLADRAFT_85070 [Melampsora larici-populina 98AG31]EGG08246.1 hypothetical protein MELLADRAFT_85070 [Melampsora larici-populina 98AG31]